MMILNCIFLNEIQYKSKSNLDLVLIRIGKYIDVLTMLTDYLSAKLYRRIIIDYCRNIKVLRYTGRIWRPPINEILMNFLPLFKNIKILTLMNCYISDEILSTCLETTTTLERLKLSIKTYIDENVLNKSYLTCVSM